MLVVAMRHDQKRGQSMSMIEGHESDDFLRHDCLQLAKNHQDLLSLGFHYVLSPVTPLPDSKSEAMQQFLRIVFSKQTSHGENLRDLGLLSQIQKSKFHFDIPHHGLGPPFDVSKLQ